MGTDHKKSSGSKKGLSAFEKAFAAARKKAGGPDGIFTFKTEKGLDILLIKISYNGIFI